MGKKKRNFQNLEKVTVSLVESSPTGAIDFIELGMNGVREIIPNLVVLFF